MCRTKEIAEYRWKEMQQDAEEDFADYKVKTITYAADTHEAQFQPAPRMDLSLRNAFDLNVAS